MFSWVFPFASFVAAVICSSIAKFVHGLESQDLFRCNYLYHIKVYKHVFQCPLLSLIGSVCSLVEKENISVSPKVIVCTFIVCELFTENYFQQTNISNVLGLNPSNPHVFVGVPLCVFCYCCNLQ